MTRKLHNTLLALSTTGLVLMAGLMAGTPLPSAAPPADAYADHAGNTTALPAVAMAPARAEAHAAAIEASALRYEAEMRKAEDPGEAIAMTATFIAGVATEAALAAALESIESATSTDDAEPAQSERKSQRKRRTSRSAFATPYFSFARGLRQGNGA